MVTVVAPAPLFTVKSLNVSSGALKLLAAPVNRTVLSPAVKLFAPLDMSRLPLTVMVSEGAPALAVSNPLKLGFKIVGRIQIHVDIKKMDTIITELKALKPLWFIVQTTGGTGIDTEFVVKDLNELNHLILEKINRIDGVLRTETEMFLNYIKRQYDWGTALD